MTLSLSDPSLLKNQGYVDGQWIDADNGETFAVTNPANGEVITEVARLGAAETTRAIEAADRAMADWKKVPAKQRTQWTRYRNCRAKLKEALVKLHWW